MIPFDFTLITLLFFEKFVLLLKSKYFVTVFFYNRPSIVEEKKHHNKTIGEQLENTEKARQVTENRCVTLDQKLTRKDTELELKDQKLKLLQNQLETLINELIHVKASIKASSKNDEQMIENLQEQCDQWKTKFETTCEDLAKKKKLAFFKEFFLF
ncbi:hypothetical protein RFI_36690, partial [Reticulomyxa filosa]